MLLKWTVLPAIVLFVAACSQSGPAQSAPPAGDSPAPAPNAAPPSGETASPAQQSPAPRADAPAAPAPSASEKPRSEKPPSEKPSEPEKPKAREVTIPAGTTLNVRLTTALASDTSRVEDQVRGSLTRPIVVDGVTAVPAGAAIVGSVLDAKESGRVKGRASIAFRFDRLTAGGETHEIRTARIAREAAADRKGDVTKGAIGAGAGAIVGGILGGGKGAAIGAGVGGTGAVVATKGKEVQLPAGTTVSTTLQEPLTVVVTER